MAIRLPLDKIDEKHLNQLKDERAYEEQSLEFKSDLNFETEGAIAEFLRDVSAIANAEGGDLIVGISEDDQGRAKDVRPTKHSNMEDLEQRIRQWCESHIKPPLAGLRFHPVKLSAGGHAVVLRIEQGWAGPHMVTYQDEFRFFVRRGRSKEKMNIDELGQRFLLGETAVRRMNVFREERIDFFRTRLGMMAGWQPPLILLHLFPVSAFAKASVIDLSLVWKDQVLLKMDDGLCPLVRYNFDGIEAKVAAHNNQSLREIQIFRNGSIEIADFTTDMGPNHKRKIERGYIEGQTIDFLRRFFSIYNLLKVEPPVFVALSILQMENYEMDMTRGIKNYSAGAVQQSDLIFPPVSMEDMRQDLGTAMRQTFDIFWQSFGFESCPLYGADGKIVF